MPHLLQQLGIPGLLIGLYLFLGCSLAQGVFQGRVVKISDGDTIHLLVEDRHRIKVRLSGIDAPERKQAFSRQSHDSLAELIAGKAVSVAWHKRDQYGRYVGKVSVGNTDAGLVQLQRGLAWHYKRFETEQSPDDRMVYARAEALAKDRGLGLWTQRSPVPPWEWRAKNRRNNNGRHT